MQTTRQHKDATTDAGAYAAGLAGQQAYAEQQAFDAGARTYDASHNVIANNASGGAGYFAEAHHTASLNIDAQRQELNTSAERLGSTAFGSPDIVVDGVQFNPKFYASAQESYNAGAQLVGEGDAVVAKYANQTIIVPSDQLVDAQRLHAEAIAQAYASNDLPTAHALESIGYADHIARDGAQSLPLSYAEAQEGADSIRGGLLPGYVGSDSSLLGNAGEGALLAASIALAASIGPQLMADVANAVRGNLSRKELASRLEKNLATNQARTTAGWAASRGVAAAAMTAVDAIDPFGAALLANLLVDTLQLSRSVESGAITPDRVGAEFLGKAKVRMGYTAVTAGSFWLVGPLGLLVPIIVKRVVHDHELQRQTLHAWQGAGAALRAELESRLRSVELVQEIGQHYRSADASAKASEAASTGIADNIAQIAKLMGGHRGALGGTGA